MILAKLSGLQKIFAQLQAEQYLPLKKFSLSRCLQPGEDTANRSSLRQSPGRLLWWHRDPRHHPMPSFYPFLEFIYRSDKWRICCNTHPKSNSLTESGVNLWGKLQAFGGNVSEPGGVSAEDNWSTNSSCLYLSISTTFQNIALFFSPVIVTFQIKSLQTARTAKVSALQNTCILLLSPKCLIFFFSSTLRLFYGPVSFLFILALISYSVLFSDSQIFWKFLK